jgi:D-alanyl-D-alanine carboxypeptidase/D-alanyl-D-alanine-endopeptidase (penicillin-binding protein 4)
LLFHKKQNSNVIRAAGRTFLPFWVVFWAGLLICCRCLANDALPDGVQKVMHEQGIDEQEFGLMVMPVDGGKVRLSRYADRPMSPASTLKVVTTMAALETLGPNFRWKTAILSAGELDGAVLHGPIYLRGGGEPNLSWDKLEMMLRQLRALGIRQIDGDLILDRSFFKPDRFDVGLPPFDSTPAQYYNVIPDALLVHSNLLDLRLASGSDAVAVNFMPPLDGVVVTSKLTLVDQACEAWDEEWPLPEVRNETDGSVQVILHGEFPRQCVNKTASNILDRDQYIGRLVRSLWRELGGSWTGAVRDGATPPNAKLLVEHVSESLSDIVKIVNKRSDNAMARTIYLTLGTQNAVTMDALSLPAAQAAVKQWLGHHHIQDDGMVLENGSGLSRIERISPKQLAEVLHVAAHSAWSSEFAASLPIAGVDGTMRKRLGKEIAPGDARLKGGTLNNTVAIAGYVRDSRGRNWIVVGMINRPDAEPGRKVLDALVDWVAHAPLPKAMRSRRTKQTG